MMKTDPLIERYSIIRKINSGGMATVYLAEDRKLGRTVALKKLHPHLIEHSDAARRFTNEAKAIASLSHDNIIKIYDFGESEKGPFLVMEFIDGTTLSESLERNGKLSNLSTVEIARQVASGLRCAHHHGIIHRDIKPANILIRKDGTVIITDFGIAHIANSQSLTLTGSFIGSPHFVCPELIQGQPVTKNSDIFSLGIVLYRCLTGVLPFDANSPHAIINLIVSGTPVESHAINPKILFWFSDLIAQCLTKDSLCRPDPAQLIDTIERKCIDDFLKIGKDTITSFINDPEMSIRQESADLFSAYRNLGIKEFRNRKTIQGLRRFEQAEHFGTLSVEDKKIRHSAISRSKRRVLAIVVSIAVLTLTLIALLSIIIQKQRIQHYSSMKIVHDTLSSQESITAIPKGSSLPLTIDTTLIRTTDHLLASEPSSEMPPVKAVSTTKNVSASPSMNMNNEGLSENNLTLVQKTDSVPQRKDGFLKIFTNPPWVTMYIDGIERGKTPKANCVILTEGIHHVTLTKEGYSIFSDRIVIKPSDTLTLRVRLQQEQEQDNSQ